MTVLTERNEIRDFPITSIAIDVMKENYLWVSVVSAISTLSIKDLPSVLLVRTWFLRFERKSIPCFYAACVRAKPSSGGVRGFPFWDIEFLTTFRTIPVLSSLLGCRRTGNRTKHPFSAAMIPLLGEFNAALFAYIDEGRSPRASWATFKMMPVYEASAWIFRNFAAAAATWFGVFHPSSVFDCNTVGDNIQRVIPTARLAAAAHSSSPEIRRDAIRAQTMKKWRHTGPKGK